MSLKKDKFSIKDRFYMSLALNLAKANKGKTGSNPSVGCIIVKDNHILSHGATKENGRPHAEVVALNKNKKKNIGSTAYISLEPCSHYGKTPPCTSALIKSKVQKVIYSEVDNDIRSYNKSKKILSRFNITTRSGLLANLSSKFYKNYSYAKKNSTPYVIGKIACSKNYHILKNKKNITNVYSRKISHLFRFENNAILTSYKTINSDNPKLSCRLNGLEKFSPIVIVIDKGLNIKLNSHVVSNCKQNKLIIFHNSKNYFKIKALKKRGVRLFFENTDVANYFDLKKILNRIYNLGIISLIVECGPSLIEAFINHKIFNEFFVFKSSNNLVSKKKVDISNTIKKLNIYFKKKTIVDTFLDKDMLIKYN
tara:strand:- start:839 stop:1939 length:1101 start_codon:yes stop_codon:yes gene_type:complete